MPVFALSTYTPTPVANVNVAAKAVTDFLAEKLA
jgi:hypothetical protein